MEDKSSSGAESATSLRCGPDGQQSAGGALTDLQRETLGRLYAAERVAIVSHGFNANRIGGERNAACAKTLAKRGLVRLERVSERHIRYRITAEGIAALLKAAPHLADADTSDRMGVVPGGPQ